MAEAAKKKQDAKNAQILLDMLNKPENRVCCECGEKGPRWASWNLGCFFCLTCAGIHRRLGTHISRVKSVTLDSWTQEQIDCIVTKGNAYVNGIYDPHPERHRPCPKGDDAGLEQFIRDKYERKLFADPAQRFDSGGGDDRKKYSVELLKLRDMGFGDEESNLQALRQSHGDLNAAVNIVVKLPQSTRAPVTATTTTSAPRIGASHSGPNTGQAALLASLANLGFKDEKKNLDALRQANGNIDQAVNILVKQAVANAQAPAPAAAAPPKAAQPVDPFGDFGAPAPAPAPTSNGGGFGDFGSAPAAAAPAPKAASNDPFGGVDIFAPVPEKKSNASDIMSLYSNTSSHSSGGFGGAPGGGFGGAPGGGFGGAPAGGYGGGFGGAPAGGFGGAPSGGYGAPAGGFGGAPAGGYGGAPHGGYGGAPAGGYGGAPAGYGGAPAGYGGAPHGGYGGAPTGGYGGAPAGGYGGAPAGYGGAPAGGYGGAPSGGYGGAPAGGNPFGSSGGAHGGYGGGAPAGGASNPFAAAPPASSQPNPFSQFGNVNPPSGKGQFNWN